MKPLMVAFVLAGAALVLLELAAGDGTGALWALLRVLGRVA
jgi:hypothetical protein